MFSSRFDGLDGFMCRIHTHDVCDMSVLVYLKCHDS